MICYKEGDQAVFIYEKEGEKVGTLTIAASEVESVAKTFLELYDRISIGEIIVELVDQSNFH